MKTVPIDEQRCQYRPNWPRAPVPAIGRLKWNKVRYHRKYGLYGRVYTAPHTPTVRTRLPYRTSTKSREPTGRVYPVLCMCIRAGTALVQVRTCPKTAASSHVGMSLLLSVVIASAAIGHCCVTKIPKYTIYRSGFFKKGNWDSKMINTPIRIPRNSQRGQPNHRATYLLAGLA